MNTDNQEKADNLSTVLDHIQKLPSPPVLVMEILESFENENVSISTLVKKIALDQAIVARVMRVANSPFFGLSGHVGSISEAVSVLGINTLRGLVTAAGIINTLPRQKTDFDWMSFWKHGIATAVSAKLLARNIGLNPENAFTAGLLHDIGKLVIGVYLPQAFSQLQQIGHVSSTESLQAEKAALGFDHATLGGEVAKNWRFPPAIQQAVGLHHLQTKIGTEISLTDVVYIANLFSYTLNDRDGGDDSHIMDDETAYLFAEAKLRLGLEPDELELLKAEAQKSYESSIMLIGS